MCLWHAGSVCGSVNRDFAVKVASVSETQPLGEFERMCVFVARLMCCSYGPGIGRL